MARETGILDKHGTMIMEGDKVCFPKIDRSKTLKVVFVGDGDDMDWAADDLDGTPDTWLDSSCEVVR